MAPRAAQHRIMRTPKPFPAAWPIGCAPKPPPWSLTDAGIEEMDGHERIEAHYKFLLGGIQQELIGVFGIEAEDVTRYVSQDDMPRFVWR